jgi:Domain of unknown function (DUF4351)
MKNSYDIAEGKILQRVLDLLMVLPAYKLKNKDPEIFFNYAFAELHKLIKKHNSEKNLPTSDSLSSGEKAIHEIYNSPSWWEIWSLSFTTLSRKNNQIGYVAAISFTIGLLSKIYDAPILIRAIVALIFAYSFLIYGLKLTAHSTDIKSTFSSLDTIIRKINEYIKTLARKDLNKLNDEKLFSKASLISKNIIEDDISSLSYYSNKLNLFHIFFALFISFIIVYISGDTFIIYIKWIAKELGFNDFDFLNKKEKFAVFILFPTGLALSKDMVASGSQRRNQLLRQSLVSLKDYLEDYQTDKQRNLVLRRLSTRISEISHPNEAKIFELSASQLEALGKALTDFSSANDLDEWLRINV